MRLCTNKLSGKVSPELFVLFGAFCLGFAPIFVKAIDLSPAMIGFYRCLLGTIFFIPLVFFFDGAKSTVQLFRTASLKFWLVVAAGGFVFSLDLFFWHHSVKLLGAGLSTMLANAQVFVLALIGLVFQKEKGGKRFWLSLVLGFLGIVFLVDFNNTKSWSNPGYVRGVLFGLLTAISYALYILSMRNCDRYVAKVSTYQKNMIISFFSALGLLLIGLFTGEASAPGTPNDIGLLIGLALSAQVLGWVLISRDLPRVEVSRAGLLILGQPVFSTILGHLIFGETLGVLQWCGSVLTLFAMYLGNTRKKQPLPSVPVTLTSE